MKRITLRGEIFCTLYSILFKGRIGFFRVIFVPGCIFLRVYKRKQDDRHCLHLATERLHYESAYFKRGREGEEDPKKEKWRSLKLKSCENDARGGDDNGDFQKQ